MGAGRGVLEAAEVERLGVGPEGRTLTALMLVLLAFGLAQLYSASIYKATAAGLPAHAFAARQALGIPLALALAFTLGRMDYRRLWAAAWPLVGVAVGLLLLTVLPGTEAIAPRINGARRWLILGPVAFQPAELAKFALLVWTAMLTVKKGPRLRSLRRGLAPFLVIWGIVAVLVTLQPNFSAAMLLLALASLTVLVGGGRVGHFVALAVAAAPVLWFQVASSGYRWRRWVALLDPARDPSGIGYQVQQALVAVGSGGVAGVGFGQSMQKMGFLPEPHNDFLYAIFAEEWGWLGTLALVLAFALLLVIGYRIAWRAPDRFGTLLAVSMTNLLVGSFVVHLAVSLALAPPTGVMLPFFSYGRSGLLLCGAAVGVLLAVARASYAKR